MVIWVGRSIASPRFFEKSPLEPRNTAASWPAQEATRGEPRVRERSVAIADEGGLARGRLPERKGAHGRALGLRNLRWGQHPRVATRFQIPGTFSMTASHLELACAERPSFLLPVLAIHAPITPEHCPTSREQGQGRTTIVHHQTLHASTLLAQELDLHLGLLASASRDWDRD